MVFLKMDSLIRIVFRNGLTLFVSPLLTAFASAETKFQWKRDPNSIALEHVGKTLWKFQSKAGNHKPFFHPLATTHGDVLTIDQPADHIWHHGLWYSFKFLNGVNFWEENPKTGQAKGMTQVVGWNGIIEEWNARIEMNILYINPNAEDPGKQKLLNEKRIILVSTPDDKGNYTIDFTHHFRALKDVTMDRTPLPGEPNGKGYGGYAGFSLRHHTDLRTEPWNFVAPGEDEPLHGSRYPWLAYLRTGEDSSIGTAIFDHPRNPRHPAPWYVLEKLPFYSPCFLFDSNWKLRKGDEFSQKYRVRIYSTAPDKAQLAAEWAAYTESAADSGKPR